MEYQKFSGIRIDYQEVGSGNGINMLLDKKVDFGASDIFISDQDIKKLGIEPLNIPTCVGAVVIIYNLPGKPALKLDSDVLTDLFMGKITNWSDKRIKAINGNIQLPPLSVNVVHRSDSSGTNYIITDYLSKTDTRWKASVGRGKLVNWPFGMGVQRNAGVAEMVKRIPGSIGYVELNYAESKSLQMALIKNRAGRFVKPTLDSVASAANVYLPDDSRVMITDTAIPDGYPISSFTYILFYREQSYNQRSEKEARALNHFLIWIVSDGQKYTRSLLYAPLPKEAVNNALKTIHTMTFNSNKVE